MAATNNKLPRRIMAVRLSSLGDVAMLYPVLKVMEQNYPDTEILLVSRPFFRPVFQDLRNVRFIPADVDKKYKGLRGLWKLFRELKKYQPEIFLDLHDVLRTKILRSLFRLSGIPVKVINKGRKEKRRLVKRPLKESKPLKTTHERYADVFRKAGFKVDLSDFKPVKPQPDNQIRLFLTPFQDVKRIGIAPLAKHPGKQYPLGGTKEVIARILQERPDINIFLFGSPDEKALLDSINPDPDRVFNLAGIFPFDQELQLIGQLDLMLSMDSGNGHLAANYGVPVVTVWGITHPYAGFAPFGQKPEQQILPDTEKFPLLPCSIYGNIICPGYEKIWDDVLPEHIAEKVIQNL